MIALKPFSVKIGGIAYHVPAGSKIPGKVLEYWQSVKSGMIAENTPAKNDHSENTKQEQKKERIEK
jgi:hypothetical protein